MIIHRNRALDPAFLLWLPESREVGARDATRCVKSVDQCDQLCRMLGTTRRCEAYGAAAIDLFDMLAHSLVELDCGKGMENKEDQLMSETRQDAAVPVAAEPIQLSYVSLAGEDVPAATRDNAHLLQHAADYQSSARNLRLSGIGDTVWGAINCTIAIALLNQRVSIVGLGLMSLGTMLMGVGLWLAIRPTPFGTIIDGIMLLLIALWNAGIAVLVIMAGVGQPPVIAAILCITQTYWGIWRIRRYPRFAAAVAMQPSAASVKWLADLSNATLNAKSRKDAAIIEFTRQGGLVYERWKGRLLPEVGVFVSTTGQLWGRRETTLVTLDGIEILQAKKKLLAKKYRLKLRLKDRTVKVVMPEPSLMKLREWLGAGTAVAALASKDQTNAHLGKSR